MRKAAACCTQPSSAKRIVTAGIEENEIEPRAGTLHLAHHQRRVQHFEINIGFAFRIGGDRHEIVFAAHLNSVPGVIEEANVSAEHHSAEAFDNRLEAGLVEIELRAAADELEAERSQRFSDQLCVVCRIGEGGKLR